MKIMQFKRTKKNIVVLAITKVFQTEMSMQLEHYILHENEKTHTTGNAHEANLHTFFNLLKLCYHIDICDIPTITQNHIITNTPIKLLV